MGHGDAGFGQDFFELLAAVFDGLDLVVQKVALPAALEFAQHRLADHARALVAHKGLDGQTALGRGGDHAQIAQALQSHAHGAGDGRGGEREHVDFGPQGLHGLFVAHAKAVFFVDDEQAQVMELGGFAQQLVRADHNVHRAVGNAFEGGGDFLARAKARDLGHFDGPFGKAVFQGLEVLLGQQGGGGQNRHLFAAGHRHKSGAQRHFGLAKTHIAAHQAVHGARADHVLDDAVDGCLLVGGFFKAEIVGKGFVILWAVAERVALACSAAGVDIEQLGGRVAHLLGGAAFGFFPLARAQLVQRRFVGAHARVAANQLQLAHRHIQRGIARVFEVQKLLQGGRAVLVFLAHVHVDQTPVTANAVLAVHHRVAHVQLAQVFDQRFDVADLFLLFAAAGGGPCGKEFGFGDQVHAVLKPVKTADQGRRGHADFFVAGQKIFKAVEDRWREAAGTHKVKQAFAAAIAFGQDQHAGFAAVDVRLQPGQRVFGTAHHRQIGQGLGQGVVLNVVGAGSQCQLGMAVGQRVELLGAQKQGVGRQHRPLGVALHQAVAVFGVLPKALECGLQITMQDHGGRIGLSCMGARAQVVKYGGGFFKEQRQVVLDARRGHAVAHVFVDAAFGRVAFQQFAPAAPESRSGRLVHRELAPGQQAHFGHGVQAALAVGVKGADGVDFVVKQIHPVRHR